MYAYAIKAKGWAEFSGRLLCTYAIKDSFFWQGWAGLSGFSFSVYAIMDPFLWPGWARLSWPLPSAYAIKDPLLWHRLTGLTGVFVVRVCDKGQFFWPSQVYLKVLLFVYAIMGTFLWHGWASLLSTFAIKDTFLWPGLACLSGSS